MPNIDMVLNCESEVVFSGLPLKTEEWLIERSAGDEFEVLVGRSAQRVSVKEYLSHKKYLRVLNLVQMAMHDHDVASRLAGGVAGTLSHADHAARRIMLVFGESI